MKVPVFFRSFSIGKACLRGLNSKYFAFLAFFMLLPQICQAQILSTHLTYDDEVKKARNFAALDDSLFGDKINLQDGSLSFTQDDVVVSTNSQLKLSFGRKAQFGSKYNRDTAFNILGDKWEPNIPYMMGTYDTRDGWNAGTDGRRCSNGSTGSFAPKHRMGPYPNYYTQPIYPYMYWHGVNISIPGYGDEQLLYKDSAQTLPSDGKVYVGITKSTWAVSCIATIKNGTGEGFAVTLPDGITYYFDWIATRNAPDLADSGLVEDGSVTNVHLLAPLSDVFLYATKAVDRFGNTVTYTYDAVYPNRIKTIASNDGAQITISYNATGQVSSVSTGSQTWQYAYTDLGLGFKSLSSVTLPDSTKWLYEFVPGGVTSGTNFWGDACKQDPGSARGDIPPTTVLSSYAVTHPSGARGDFRFRSVYHGTNNTPGGCEAAGSVQTSLGYRTYGIPSAYIATSLYQKTISGNGISGKVWTYYYYPTWSFSYQCTNGCASTSQTTVETQDGVKRRYTFGNSYSSNMGQLLSETVEKNAVIQRTTNNTYLANATGQPFPNSAGYIPLGLMSTWGNQIGIVEQHCNPFLYLNRPMSSSTTTQDGVTFTTSINAFEQFARPTSITKSSSLGYTRTDVNAYENNLNKWVLGQVKTLTNTNTTPNVVVGQTIYDATTALPLQTYSNGQLQVTMTYNTDGTLATVKDANNSMVSLSNYKRGTAQAIALPDGKLLSAVVNDNGWLTSTTDQLGNAMSYGYDTMGRLSNVTYPLADSTLWNPQSLNFAVATAAAYGLPVGHWYQTASTGNGKVTTYYDAMWRPVLTRTEDIANAATRSFVVNRYDTSGRLAFSSYPVATLTSINDVLTGTYTEYDALGRVTKVKQDSEQGLLTMTTEYLTGFKTKVTNPRGYVTTTSYQVFDAPDTSRPVLIQSPENVTTTITRDVFGKPLSVTRTGPEG
jgi:YD repeat-containing protein